MGDLTGLLDRIAKLEAALKEFTSTINNTGGLMKDTEVNDGWCDDWVPVGDPEWSDLADAYLTACKALGVEPTYYSDDLMDKLDKGRAI